MSRFVCANCGVPCDGAINGRGFCNEKVCIDKVIHGATAPMREAMAKHPAPLRSGPPIDCGDWLK